jgi:hypothetical protein
MAFAQGVFEVGFGRIIASEIEAPNLSVNPVQSGCAEEEQSDHATEPH